MLPDGAPGPSLDVNNLENLHKSFGMKCTINLFKYDQLKACIEKLDALLNRGRRWQGGSFQGQEFVLPRKRPLVQLLLRRHFRAHIRHPPTAAGKLVITPPSILSNYDNRGVRNSMNLRTLGRLLMRESANLGGNRWMIPEIEAFVRSVWELRTRRR